MEQGHCSVSELPGSLTVTAVSDFRCQMPRSGCEWSDRDCTDDGGKFAPSSVILSLIPTHALISGTCAYLDVSLQCITGQGIMDIYQTTLNTFCNTYSASMYACKYS